MVKASHDKDAERYAYWRKQMSKGDDAFLQALERTFERVIGEKNRDRITEDEWDALIDTMMETHP